MFFSTKPAKTVPDLFNREREAWLETARATARKLLRTRYFITIEDVLTICPRPQYVHRNTTGRVFNGDFIPTGWKKSTRPLMNSRQVRTWRMNPSLTTDKNYRA